MVKALKYVVRKHFQGVPKRHDYEIVEYELPTLKNGEILVKTEWISVDPYHRAYNSFKTVPFDQFGFQVAVVEESKDPKYPVGTRIVSHNGWCTHSILKTDPKITSFPEKFYELPDLQGLSSSLGIGALGMPGATAYFGLLDVCQPKAGETVVVTGAAGAVGSIVGQIARIKGCRVIGFAGSDDKVHWLESELGFDKAFNYKTVDVAKVLKSAAPNGVDCYFDNVGGEISSIIIYQMNAGGRVAVCGSISSYNDPWSKLPRATIIQPVAIFKELTIKGFIVWRWGDRWPEAFTEIIKWIKNGQLRIKEHVTVGFENVFDAFLGMLSGDNFGKAVVQI